MGAPRASIIRLTGGVIVGGIIGLIAATAALHSARADSSTASNPSPSSSTKPTLSIPKVDGLSCPFQLSGDQQKLQDQLMQVLKEINDGVGKSPDCANVQQRIQALSNQVQQLQLSSAANDDATTTTTTNGVSTTTTTAAVTDPALTVNQELLAENMTFALGSRCASVIKDPTPLIYTTLLLTNGFGASSSLSASMNAGALLLVELGKYISKWLSRPSPVQRELGADSQEQQFQNQLCILYLYDHEIDNQLATEKKATADEQDELKKAQSQLEAVNEQLASPALCDECADAGTGNLKTQLKDLQTTLHQINGDTALVDACGDIRDAFDRDSASYKTIDGMGSSCSFSDPQACTVKDDGKITLTQADFCDSWCELKGKDLTLNFDCDDASDSGKQELRSMENRARTVLQYVLAEGGAASLDKSAIVEYQSLEAQKNQLQAQIKHAPATDATMAVQDHENDPSLRDKVTALSKQVLDTEMPSYLNELSQRDKKELKKVRKDLKTATKQLKDPSQKNVCALSQNAAAGLGSISDRLAHYQDLCTYLGNGGPALAFKDPSLSFLNQSSHLQSFCSNLARNQQSDLPDGDKQALEAQIAAIEKQASCPK